MHQTQRDTTHALPIALLEATCVCDAFRPGTGLPRFVPRARALCLLCTGGGFSNLFPCSPAATLLLPLLRLVAYLYRGNLHFGGQRGTIPWACNTGYDFRSLRRAGGIAPWVAQGLGRWSLDAPSY